MGGGGGYLFIIATPEHDWECYKPINDLYNIRE